MSKNKKISDRIFFTILRENAGLYARTCRAIKKKFDIEYSRQAVRQRAERRPDILADIEEENLDIAEEGLYTLMRSTLEQIRFKSIELFLKTRGKKRGYVEKSELGFTDKEGNDLLTLPLDKLKKIEQIISDDSADK